MTMTETAPPQEKPDRSSELGHVTDRVVDLAVLNVVLGGGLFLGALALLLLREPPLIGCYPERMTPFWVTFWIGAVASVLAGLGFTVSLAKGWSVSRRRFVTAVGAAGFALLVLQIGLNFGWNLRTRVALLCIGAALLIAGLAILRARRWGAYLEIVSMLATSGGCWYSALHPSADGMPSGELNFFGFALLMILFTFIDPLNTFLIGEQRGFIVRFAPFRILTRVAFTAFSVLALATWILMSLLGSPKQMAAKQLSRQKATLSDMRSIMTAVEKYGETHGVYPATQDIAELARVLEPSYIPLLPRNDAWGRPLEYYRVILPSGVEGYVIRSAGCDGVFEKKDPTAYTDGGVRGLERDIVFSTVSKSQWPEGLMPP
jgi:hypothetical protein